MVLCMYLINLDLFDDYELRKYFKWNNNIAVYFEINNNFWKNNVCDIVIMIHE